MTIVLTPYWSAVDGTQKLRLEAQSKLPPPQGLLPPAFSRDVHFERVSMQLRSKTSDIEKYIFLCQLKNADVDTFYRLCLANMSEITPLIYTPTVGDACLQYSHNFRRPEGLFISINDRGKIGTILCNWPGISDTRISVVTDGMSIPACSRILGLGDLGVNGMPIAIGKLSLYVAGAGIRPTSTLPITLDLGTNHQAFLDDPLYLGLRQKRASEAEYDDFMEEFMTEISRVNPKLLVQFEVFHTPDRLSETTDAICRPQDFSTDHAFSFLARFRHRFPLFNDDIQGTGAVVLSGLISAVRLSTLQPREHRILFFGAGSAGVGVATQKDYSGPPMTDLLEIVHYMKPTALMGLSTVRGAFSEDVSVVWLHRPHGQSSSLCRTPYNFRNALSLTLSVRAGAVFYLLPGSPFSAEMFGGRKWEPGQGNNMYIFPGLGLGSILCHATSVTDSMVEAAALGLANSLSWDERTLELIYPRIDRIREISARIAVAVIRAAQAANVDRSSDLKDLTDEGLFELVQKKMWSPQ
ncbi:hypothetical protein JVU11DRAFT_5782 [Chiua virens]|nr:hypothetical protein JVU11DRAFT_5782 [Chiua virens]